MSEPRPRRSARLNRVCLGAGFLIVCLVAFSYGFVPLRGSQDEWWQLKTGQWIVNHGHLPRYDIFTYTGAGMRWYNHEWLSQVIFYLVYSLVPGGGNGGLTLLISFKSLLVMLTFGIGCPLLARLRGCSWPVALLFGLLAADISRRTTYVRPPIFSYLFMVIFLLILVAWKQKRAGWKALASLPVLTIVWANLHGMVLLAPVLVGAFWADETARFFLRRSAAGKQDALPDSPPGTNGFRKIAGLTAVLVLVALACLAQPSGYHLLFLGRNFTADPLLKTVIFEMLPTPGMFTKVDPAGPWGLGNLVLSPPGFWTVWIVLAILLVVWVWNRFRFPWLADYLLCGFFVWQGIMHWRLLPLLATVLSCGGAALVAQWMNNRSLRARRGISLGSACVVPVLAVVFTMVIGEPPPETFLQRNLRLLKGQPMNLVDYPAPLMDFLIRAKLPDRMFSDSNYCGYAIWRLSPEHHKLFTDNRFDLFGSRFYALERVVLNAGQPGNVFRDGQVVKESWSDILSRFGVNFIVIRPGDHPAFQRALRDSGQWKDIFAFFAPGESPLPKGPNASRQGWCVWLRDEPRFADVVRRATQIYKEKNPGLPLPGELDAIWMGARPGPALKTDGTREEATDWRIH